MYNTPYHSADLSKYSFLITGGAGFIGSNIVEYLLKFGAGKVRVLDNLATGFRDNVELFKTYQNFEFINGDITSLEDCLSACKGIDFVSHQAALGSVPRSINNPIATNEVNINGFLNILVAARDEKVQRIVYASSSSVYGDSKILPKTEPVIGKPLSPYAVTKLVDELYADVFSKIYGMNIIGLRYFNIFGPRQTPDGAYAAAIPLFISAIINNEAPRINGDGEQTRDFTFVENAVQANIKALFAEKEEALGAVFNIAYGERISLNKLMTMLNKVSNSTIQPVYGEERAGDVRDSLADISKAKALLGYEPTVRTEEGLVRTFEWLRGRQ